MKKRHKRVIFYTDELGDDFALTRDKIDGRRVDNDYRYIREGFWYRLGSFVLYRLVAIPLGTLYCKAWLGLRVKGRENLRGIKGGYFIYGNHTQNIADAFIPTLVTLPRRCNIVTGAETVSIKGIGTVVGMLGAVPIGSTFGAKKNFYKGIKHRIERGEAVAIYPEAHIWPYYNGIRSFPSGSFAYPERLNVPCVGFTVVYRQRKIFKKLHPCATVYIGKPVYPDENIGKEELHDEIIGFMKQTVEEKQSCEYIKYVKRQDVKR